MSRLGVLVLPWLTVFASWVALWGDPAAGTVVAGAVVATAVVALVGGARTRRGRLRPLAALRFTAHVAWNLVKATFLVAWEVVTPRNRIVEGIIAVSLPDPTPVVLLAVTNAIGLTPGTVVVDLDEDPCVLYVHVLHLIDIDAVREDLARLVALATAAFGPPAVATTRPVPEAGG